MYVYYDTCFIFVFAFQFVMSFFELNLTLVVAETMSHFLLTSSRCFKLVWTWKVTNMKIYENYIFIFFFFFLVLDTSLFVAH